MDDSGRTTEVRVLFFAKARELAGVNEKFFTVPKSISADQLLETIVAAFKLEVIKGSLILAVNEEFVEGSSILELTDKDEVAVIPPLSGEPGANMEEPKNIVQLQKDKLNINDIIEAVTSPACGAISTFIGTTRDNFESKKVLKLEYEAYEPMALKEMSNICSKIREKWSVHHIAIYHRLGEVPVCESSVAIAISSPHRQESLQAVQFAIDTLKSSVPIWKKEVYNDQGADWKENKEWNEKNVVVKTEPLDDNDNESEAEEEDDREEVKVHVDPSQVQVKVSTEELNRRIEAFISRKRDQNNMFNIQEFCGHRHIDDENESSCARVDAIVIARKDSKSHVKVHRVFNAHGPQTMNFSAVQTPLETPQTSGTKNSVLDERLSGPEKFLGIEKPVPRDIYQRIKNIEDRIMYLESLSPEYREFFAPNSSNSEEKYQKPVRKRTYSTAELDNKLMELEEKYFKRLK